jgi:integrase
LFEQEITREQQQKRRIYRVIEGLKSPYTIKAYRIAFEIFLRATLPKIDGSNYDDDANLQALLDTKQNVIKIIDHISYLKDVRRLTYLSIKAHLSGIFHFFEINDYELNTKKIKRFMPAEDESDYYAKDRPYSVNEIEQILSKCDVRAKACVLIMASTGMRVGGLKDLQIGDLKKIDEFGLYMIWVYNRSRKDRYYIFTTPECARAIDDYLAYRERSGGEDVSKDKSPLIRDMFQLDNYFKAPKFVSVWTLLHIFEDVLKRSGVNRPTNTLGKSRYQRKRDVMRSHGFRKFFITQCDKANLNFTVREYLSGHKLPNMDANYIRTTEEDRLAEYVKAIPLLTIDPTQRLKQENQDLKTNQAKELKELRSQVEQHTKELNIISAHAEDMSSVANQLHKCFVKLGNEQIKSPEEAKAFYKRIVKLAQRVDNIDDLNEFTEIAKELGVEDNTD